MFQKIAWESLAVLLIGLAVLVGYCNSFQAPFVFDDHRNIEEVKALQIEDLSATTLYNAATSGPTPRPLAYASFALNFYFGGHDVWGFHLVNVSIHFLNGVLVCLLVRFVMYQLKSSGSVDDRAISAWGIGVTAAIFFVVHPVQVQSVTYIVQRMASLCTMFYLAALICYLCGRTSLRFRRYVWWLLCFFLWVLALGTKQFAVTLPLAILLCEWILFQNGERKWLYTGAKYLGAVVVLMGVVLFIFKGVDAPKLLTRGYDIRDFTLTERLMTEGRVMIHYISLILLPLPSRLTLVYDYPISKGLLAPVSTIVCWLTIIALVAWSLANANRNRLASFSILWFFLHLAVESTIIPLEIIYEHRIYLPLVGVGLLASVGIARTFKTQVPVVLSTIILCGLMAWGTHLRNDTWQSAIGLWEDNISKQPTEARSWFNLGRHFMETDDRGRIIEAFGNAINFEPRMQRAYFLHALYLKNVGKRKKALTVCQAGLIIPPESVRGDNVYLQLNEFRAELLIELGRHADAMKVVNAAIERFPDRSIQLVLRAQCYLNFKQPFKAAEDFKRAIEIEPDSFLANNNYAWMLATHPNEEISNSQEAIKCAKVAGQKTNFRVREALVTLAAAYARDGNFDEAIRWQARGIQMATAKSRPQLIEWLKLYKNKTPLIVN